MSGFCVIEMRPDVFWSDTAGLCTNEFGQVVKIEDYKETQMKSGKNTMFTSSAKSGSPLEGKRGSSPMKGAAAQKGMKPMNTAKPTKNGRA